MRNRFTFILLFLSILLHAQSVKKRLALGEQFCQKVRVREVLDTMLWKEEAKIFGKTEKFFEQYHLRSDIKTDYNYFQSNLMRQFLFSKRHILDRIKYEYQHHTLEDLTGYLNEINRGKRQDVIHSSGLYDNLKNLLNEEMSQIRKYTVPKYLEVIERRHQPIKLNLKQNGKPVLAKDLDLEVYVITNNADHQKVSILDKENNQLLKPDGYSYEQIQKLIITYKGKEFEFQPAEYVEKLPKQLKQVHSFISRYSFEEIPEWDIRVRETPNSTAIKLVNVVEAKIIKNNPVNVESPERDLQK